jgi:hypothetical protein
MVIISTPLEQAQQQRPENENARKTRAFAMAQARKQPRSSAVADSLFAPLGFGFVLQNLTATVKAVGADVVAQVNFTGGGLHGGTWGGQGVVRTVHAALGRGLFVLLNGHGRLLDSGKKTAHWAKDPTTKKHPARRTREIVTGAKPEIIARTERLGATLQLWVSAPCFELG